MSLSGRNIGEAFCIYKSSKYTILTGFRTVEIGGSVRPVENFLLLFPYISWRLN